MPLATALCKFSSPGTFNVATEYAPASFLGDLRTFGDLGLYATFFFFFGVVPFL